MFKGGREFRLIAFTSPNIRCPQDLINLLPTDKLSAPDDFAPPSSDCSLLHFYYFSEQPFSASHEEIEEIQITKDGSLLYRYNMYVTQFSMKDDRTVSILAVPFNSMAAEVFPFFNDNVVGLDNEYIKINIQRFVAAVKEARHLNGGIKITRLEFDITGDAPSQTAILGGTDVPNSMSFDKIKESLQDMSLEYKKCKFYYDNKAPQQRQRIVVDTDRFGNYVIPLHSGGKNLPSLRTIFHYLQEVDSLVYDGTFPSQKSL